MENELIVNLQKQIESITASLEDLTRSVTLLKLHDQSYIKAGEGVKPGISTKVAYDNNGLIIKGTNLEREDIPNLSIDQIDGLRNYINSVENIKGDLLKEINSIEVIRRSNNIKETGCKVNVDDNGFVVSTAPLLSSDLPKIPIDQVEGLSDKLESLSNKPISTNANVSESENLYITPGTYTKLTINSEGNVVKGAELSVEDIPREIVTKINQLESVIPKLADRESLNTLSAKVSDISIKPSNIEPGTYTKVMVSSDGIILSGSKLSINDLPQITIDNIPELRSILSNKADISDYINLHDSMETISKVTAALPTINNLIPQIESKANKSDLVVVENDVKEIRNTINNLLDVTSLDSLLAHIKKLEESINNIEGRVSAIEFKLKMQNDFDTN